MMELNRRNTVGMALVGLAVVLFVLPALFPVQPVLTHDTRDTVPLEPEEIDAEGFTVIPYENLSDRGQELYIRTLEHSGEYRVAKGHGAPDFAYPTDEERRRAYQDDDDRHHGRVVIKRPADDSGLPASDERFYAERREVENETAYREQVLRYDAMQTGTEHPPMGSAPQLIRLIASLLAVLSLGIGGYLISSR